MKTRIFLYATLLGTLLALLYSCEKKIGETPPTAIKRYFHNQTPDIVALKDIKETFQQKESGL